MRPYYPASDPYRVVRDSDGLQVDFMTTIHGWRSFEGVKARAQPIEVQGVSVLVASLADVIKSKRAAGRPRALPTERCWRSWRNHLKKPNGRRRKLDAVARESEHALRDLIRRWQALPPGRRTNFLRTRVGRRGTAI